MAGEYKELGRQTASRHNWV